MNIAIASKNLGKMQEFKFLFKQFLSHITDVHLSGLKEFPEMDTIVEDGNSFHQNARKKALLTAEHTGLLSIADDSGLEVDALNGAPGIYSARFAGEHATDDENMQLLLEKLKDIPGLCYRENGKLTINQSRGDLISFDDYPFPSRHLLDNSIYRSFVSQRQKPS